MKTPPPLPDSRRVFGYAPDSALLLIGAFLVFLLFRPYQGIIHDARLYVGYAMAALDPDGIGRDIVFVNDGQSKFSVYPLLMRSLAKWIGPSRAAMALTYGGLLLWFAAFAVFARRLLGERFSDAQVIAVTILAVSLPSFYGGQGVFRFAEHFATPRVFAEASVLAAFAAILARRTALSMIALALGLAFHPLIAAPGVAVIAWYLAESPRDRNALIGVAVGGTGLLLVATLTLHASDKPFAQFDAEWLAAINTKHALVFLKTWRWGDVIRIVLHVVTIALAMPALEGGAQRVVRSSIVVAAGGLTLSMLGGDLAHNVLVTQGQAWRGLWLLAVLATVMQGVLLHSVWRHPPKQDVTSERDLRRAASLLLLVAWFMVEINSTALVFALLAGLLWTLPRVRPDVALPASGALVIGALTCVVIACQTAVQTWVTVTTIWSSPDTSMRLSLFNVVATGVPGLLVLASVTRILASATPASTRARSYCQPLFLGLLLLASFKSDARTRYQRYVERELDSRVEGVPPPLSVPRGNSVLWPYADLETWAFAGAPGWGTIVQGMPSVFDRHLAIAWAARTALLEKAGLLSLGQTGAETIAVLSVVVDERVVESLCAPPDPPSVVVVPKEAGARLSGASTHRPDVARALYPLSMGQRWSRIDAYSVVRCSN